MWIAGALIADRLDADWTRIGRELDPHWTRIGPSLDGFSVL
jgi:hypothetical protein